MGRLVHEEHATLLSSLIATNFNPIDERVLSLPKRKPKAERPVAEQVAAIMFPSYTPEKAVIQYELARIQARRVYLLQMQQIQAEIQKKSEYLRLQGPWDPTVDPISNDGPIATPMPVKLSNHSDFKDVFAFLASNGQPGEVVNGTEPIFGTPFVEFPRGVVYTDGRLDLCKMIIGPDHISELMQSLETNSVVRHFLLGNNVITNHGARCIADFIQKYPERMETWYLAGNHIKPQGFKELAEALHGSPVLTNLWMKRNPLGPKSATVLAELVQRAPKLRTLDVETTELGDIGVARFFSSLATSTCDTIPLQTIYLNSNGLGVGAMSAIAQYLQSPQCRLTGLFLASNPVGDEGAAALAVGLAKNTTLLRLSLNSCGITSKGIRTIASALADHDCILSVNLAKSNTTTDLNQRFNHIDDSAVDALSKLIMNPSMRHLDLGRTALSMDGINELRAAVIKSDLVVYNAFCKDAEYTCSKEVRDRLVANHARLYNDGVPYDKFSSVMGPSRYLRNDDDVRLIDSVYRTRDKRMKNKSAVGKFWDAEDALWKRLDAIA